MKYNYKNQTNSNMEKFYFIHVSQSYTFTEIEI